MSRLSLHDDPRKTATDKGVTCVLPGLRDIQIDVDDEQAGMTLADQLVILGNNGILFTITDDHPSKSGLPRRHVTLTVDHDPEARDPVVAASLALRFRCPRYLLL